MKECSDKRYRDLLHAYELGMLDDDRRRAFEAHLLECDACYEQVRRFQAASRLLNQDWEVRNLAARAGADESPEQRRARRVGLWSWAPVTLAAAAVLLFLVLKPWQIEIRPTEEAVAAGSRLVVLNFEDLSDPDGSGSLAPVVTNLLIADLAQGGVVDVASALRMYDIARMLGQPDPALLDRSTASQVASKAGAGWIVVGTIVVPPPAPVITAQLIEAATGEIETAFEVTGHADEDLYSIVDRLSSHISGHFAGQLDWTGSGQPLAQVTSPSLEAYGHYLDGVDKVQKLYYEQAVKSFQRALELDPGLAMAYYYLAQLLDRSLITQAMQHLDRAGKREQAYIIAKDAAYRGDLEKAIRELETSVEQYPDEKQGWYLLGQYARELGRSQEAIANFERAVELDPSFRSAYNQLAYLYDAGDDGERAIAAATRYVELAPDEANPYDTQGEILARYGRLKQAIAAFEKAVEINPDYYHSRAYLGFMYTFDRQYERADSIFERLTFQSHPRLRQASRLYAVYPLVYRGQFSQALSRLDELIALRESGLTDGASPRYPSLFHHLKATILREQGNNQGALAEATRCLDSLDGRSHADSTRDLGFYVALVLDAGNTRAAEQVISGIAEGVSLEPSNYPLYDYLRGILALHSREYDAAVELLEKGVLSQDNYIGHVTLGQAYLAAGRTDKAETLFRDMLDSYTSPRAYNGVESVKLHYYLGQVLEAENRPDQAAEAYALFLDIWSQADQATASIQDARRRLDRLRQRP